MGLMQGRADKGLIKIIKKYLYYINKSKKIHL